MANIASEQDQTVTMSGSIAGKKWTLKFPGAKLSAQLYAEWLAAGNEGDEKDWRQSETARNAAISALQAYTCTSYTASASDVSAKYGQKTIEYIQRTCYSHAVDGRSDNTLHDQSGAPKAQFGLSGEKAHAQDLAWLKCAINIELERRSQFTHRTDDDIEGDLVATDWNDMTANSDFTQVSGYYVDYVGTGTQFRAGQPAASSAAAKLISCAYVGMTDPEYQLVDPQSSAIKAACRKLEDLSNRVATGEPMSTVAKEMYSAVSVLQDECACYTDCNGYAVCFCYSHCNHY